MSEDSEKMNNEAIYNSLSQRAICGSHIGAWDFYLCKGEFEENHESDC